MIKLIQLIIFILLLTLSVFPEEIDTLFQKGNQYYQNGNYNESAKIYESIAEKGYAGKSLFYNLGNAYFRAGKIGLAILYYEKAKKLSPSDDDVNYNLAFANSKVVDKIETLPRFFIFDWWENILALFTVTGWAYLSYIFYFLILISIGYYYFAKSLKGQRLAFYSGLISAFFLILTIILLLVNLNRELNVKHGIVVESAVVVKFSPDQNSKDAFIVHEGLKVKAEDKVNNWIKIKLIDGKVGWLDENTLRII